MFLSRWTSIHGAIHLCFCFFAIEWCSYQIVHADSKSDDILVADFESDSYENWHTSGEAFGPGPARGTLPGQMAVTGYRGDRLVNTFFNGDQTTGTLTSPSFKIERDYLSYLIGGGHDPKRLALRLIVDGEIVRIATGSNDRPGGTEELSLEYWDVQPWKGKTGTLQIVDEAKGGWGHINVDHLVQTDTKPLASRSDVTREIKLNDRYLLFPIKNGAKKRVVTFAVDGKVIVRNEMELSDGNPDWWAPMNVTPWSGQTATIVIDKLPASSLSIDQIYQSDQIPGDFPLYQEPKRAQFHFSPLRGWNNDPNGLVYYRGEYHLFFQHNPYGWGWGNMHWGHAVSQDLVHWVELGDKLLPDDMGPMFSGSAVVDWNNTSELGEEGNAPLILLYTAAGNPTVQGLAYSNDGRNFKKLETNPILPQVTPGNRDPKVIWHAPSQSWIMVLYVELPGKQHTVHFYSSKNLKDWTLESVTRGGIDGDKYLFECPDFFPLAIDGDSKNTKWVLLAADSQYAVGTFDGKSFQPEIGRLPGHRGRGFYAAQSFSDIPAEDGRRILIGWLQTETKDMPFNQSMSLPLELGLTQTADGPRMTFQPVAELKNLRKATHGFNSSTQSPRSPNPLSDLKGEHVEILFNAIPSSDAIMEWDLRGEKIRYIHATRTLEGLGVKAALPTALTDLNLRFLVDRNSIEIFAASGQIYIPLPLSFSKANEAYSYRTLQGEVEKVEIQSYELQSAWNKELHR